MARVLVVEDQELVRRSMRAWLEQVGHEVAEAADGEMALQVLGQSAADVVVTDIVMPNLEGLELIRRMRQTHPAVRIVVVSGAAPVGGVSLLETARKLGADEAIPKPFTPRDLTQAVLRCLHLPARAAVGQYAVKR